MGTRPDFRADAPKFHRVPGGRLNGFSSIDGMSVNGVKPIRGPRIIGQVRKQKPINLSWSCPNTVRKIETISKDYFVWRSAPTLELASDTGETGETGTSKNSLKKNNSSPI
jgi:hypothetical protein